MFNLIEARIFDKAVPVRKTALQQLKLLADHILKVKTGLETIELYQKVLAQVTDDKPSIRKEALLTIKALTKVIADRFVINDEARFSEILEKQ